MKTVVQQKKNKKEFSFLEQNIQNFTINSLEKYFIVQMTKKTCIIIIKKKASGAGLASVGERTGKRRDCEQHRTYH